MIPELDSRENSRQARLRAEHFKTYQKALERDNFQSVLEEYHCVNKTDPTCPNITRATLVYTRKSFAFCIESGEMY